MGILGPTGVGKTRVAAELAAKLGTRIVSCDSMQVYAGFPVLTNQPRGEGEGEGVHEVVGIVDPSRSFSVGDYAAIARPLVAEEVERHGVALVVGGSGLYLRAAVAPLAAHGFVDPAQRRRLEERAQKEGGESLHAELARLDPQAANSIDARNLRRVIRALEVVLASGQSWSGRSDLWAPAYDYRTFVVGLVTDRAVLAGRILERSERMMAMGAVEEVARFRRERGKDSTRPGNAGICSAIGYGEISDLLDGEQSPEQTVERIASATRQYARRQVTWLRKVKDAVMIDVREREAGDVAREILEAMARNEAAGGMQTNAAG